MRKRLSQAVRLLLAAAGLTYIGLSLTWTDHIVLPVGYVISPETVATEPMTGKVVVQDETGYTVSLEVDGQLRQLHLAADSVVEHERGGDISQPVLKRGVVALFARADPLLLGLGVLLVGFVLPMQGFRWWVLMRCQGMMVSYARALRLTLVGHFFNFCMPGTTGGDVMKAYYAARGNDRRSVAVMSVIFDRAAGLLGLILLGMCAGLTMLENETTRNVTLGIIALLSVLSIAAVLYYSNRTRQILAFERRLSKLPAGSKLALIDHAALSYRSRPWAVVAAVALSFVVHIFMTTATAMAGYAFGLDVPIGVLLTIVPVVLVAGSVPLTYQGVGVVEGLAVALLVDPPMALENQVIGMFLMLRLFQLVFAVLSVPLALQSDIRLFKQEAAAESEVQAVEQEIAQSPAD